MSDNVTSYGRMALLLNPMPKEERETFYEKTDLHVNYEGTIIYSDDRDRNIDDEGYGLFTENHESRLNFVNKIRQNQIQLKYFSVFYCCVWYNGADSPMDEMTAKEFKQKIFGENNA